MFNFFIWKLGDGLHGFHFPKTFKLQGVEKKQAL